MKQFFLFAAFLLFVVTSVNSQNQKESIKTPKPNPVGHVLSAGQPSGVAVAYIAEGFEDTLFPPPGWTTTTTLGTVVWDREYGFFYTGNACAWADYSSVANEKWLITPQVTITAGDSLSFWIRRQYTSAYPPDSLYIMVSTTDANLTSFTTTLVAYDVSGLLNEWARYANSLNAYAGQNIYIAFKHRNTDGNGFNMDDVGVGTPVVPVELVSFTASAINNNVVLNWSTATETNNMGFEVERK
ncbi:MAG: choice-of-anchor J domain-containing protein [Ignavibacteriales bacterium]|nr:choice-of-anchor J domain-containing protein [Ignavibacteriales bacterium]